VSVNYDNNIQAGIAQRYSANLRAGWSGVRVPVEAGNFPLHHRIQTGSGAHPASYPMGTRGSFLGGKAAGACTLTTHLHIVPRSRMRGAIPPLQYAFMAWCSVEAQEQLYLYLYLLCTGWRLWSCYIRSHNVEIISGKFDIFTSY
jgi:hypothetical protein